MTFHPIDALWIVSVKSLLLLMILETILRNPLHTIWYLFNTLNPNQVDVSDSSLGGRGGLRKPIGQYLSCLWSNFKNSFVWWNLVKIIIDFYSISNFLSLIIWPLKWQRSVASIFFSKNPKFQFFSYRHIMYLKRTHFSCRFEIDKEKIGFDCRNWEKIHFSNFCLKNEGDQLTLQADFQK